MDLNSSIEKSKNNIVLENISMLAYIVCFCSTGLN